MSRSRGPLASESIRVLHLIKGLGRGGAEMLLPLLIRNAGEPFRYSVGYFLPWKDALVPPLRRMGVEVSCFTARGPGGMLAQIPRVAWALRKENIDLVHAHLPLAGVVARLAGRLAGVPVVYTEHNVQERYHPLTRRVNLATWFLQAAAIAVSGEVAESLARRTKRKGRIAIVRNGIDVPGFDITPSERAMARQTFNLLTNVPVVGTVAVFRTQKRLDVWLQAAAMISERIPAARFMVVGDGPLYAELQGLSASLGILEGVLFPGLLEDVRPALAAMDVYMMSSDFEGLPLALLEAMAAGLPVVATSVGGIPEVIDAGVSGFLVARDDPRDLADTVMHVLDDQDASRLVGAAGRQVVKERFGIERMAREVESVYRLVLGSDVQVSQ